jgi:O-acetyl-ADP-ribose deacetylase (regulator of RNase III)
MISQTTGSLFKSGAEALVNPVNLAGVMGKGLALQFKVAYPANFRDYAKACADGRIGVGKLLVHGRGLTARPSWIINFPTKRDWRQPSRFGDVDAGLVDLRQVIVNYEIRSVAVPALGCGLGGLDYGKQVWPLIVAHLGDLEDVRVLAYGPE